MKRHRGTVEQRAQQDAKALRLYKEGMARPLIAERLGISMKRVLKVVKELENEKRNAKSI